MLDTKQIKADFPVFKHYPKLIYLDNASTAHKPKLVINSISQYYQTANANIHRGVHKLSDLSTLAWQESRKTIASFFGAKPEELIVTRNTTESINGVAYAWAEQQIKAGDVILSTVMEHHANIVPWQELCKRTGAQLKFIPVLPAGELDMEWLATHLDKTVKLVAVTWVSNVLGTINAVARIVELTHEVGARVLIDAAQAVAHLPIDFRKLNADFLVFSGHKMYGPMGVGGLLVKKVLLDSDEFKPWLFGGGMIEAVSENQATYQSNPADRFTAGTPDVASIVGLAEACKYLQAFGFAAIAQHEQSLLELSLLGLQKNSKIKLIGPVEKDHRLGSVAFIYNGVHAHDVAQILDSQDIAVRSGHHCCMPLHTHFDWQATTRASFGLYNSLDDIEKLLAGLEKVAKVFGM